jgi:catechol 2,3-dioxygenase-like lactoylglutathione lyase family enzyme
MNVTGFNHAAVNVEGRLAECEEFYGTVLGLVQQERALLAQRVKGAWFQIGSTQIHMADELCDGRPRNPIGPHISLWVDDIAAAVAELKTQGIAVFAIGEGVTQVVWCADPAGNTIELQQEPISTR